MVPHSCLEKANGHIRKKHSMKFLHIAGYNVDPYGSYGQSFFPKSISVWNGLAQEIAEANILWIYSTLNWHIISRATHREKTMFLSFSKVKPHFR